MTRNDRRDGFALAITLVIMLVLTGGVITAMSQATTDGRVVDSDIAGLEALSLAEAGLEMALDSWAGAIAPPADGTTLHFDFETGSADVVVRLIRPSLGADPSLYVIRSRGTHTRGGWASAPDAARTVAQLATWTDGDMDVRAGWVSLGGLSKSGASGQISGVDGCGEEGTVGAVAVPEGGYTQDGGSIDDVLEGSPLVDTLATGEQSVPIDWEGIVNGGALEPDYTIPPDGWPTFQEGEWPIIYVDTDGTYQLPGAGHGTLIVRGDLAISGNNMWEGVIMVGGKLTLSGSTTVSGSALSGLNALLPGAEDPAVSEAIDDPDLAHGNITVQFHSCNVEAAMQRFAGFQVYTNTWIDNWAMY